MCSLECLTSILKFRLDRIYNFGDNGVLIFCGHISLKWRHLPFYPQYILTLRFSLHADIMRLTNLRFIIACPMQCMALDRCEITWVYVCLCVCMSVRNTYRPRSSQILNVGHTSDNKRSVRSMANNARNNKRACASFTSRLAHF